MPDIRGKSEWKAERVGACLEPAHCALHDTAIDYFEPDGLSVANLIQSEIDTYRREQDSIAQFIEECCETFEQAKIDRPDEYIISTD